eukprot:1350327-Amphidinium_carterae.1
MLAILCSSVQLGRIGLWRRKGVFMSLCDTGYLPLATAHRLCLLPSLLLPENTAVDIEQHHSSDECLAVTVIQICEIENTSLSTAQSAVVFVQW